MKKDRRKLKDEDGFTTCHICGCSLRTSRLDNHLKRVHKGAKLIDTKKSKPEKRIKEAEEGSITKKELRMLQGMLGRQAMQRNVLCVALVALIVFLPFAYTTTASTEEVNIGQPTYLAPQSTLQPQSETGYTKAPDFTGVDVITGETVSLSQFSGTVVLLNFVNYGCDPQTNQVVSAQLLAIKNLTEQRDDFIPLSVFCGCCPEETLRNFATENGLNWSWILDSDYSIIKLYIEQVNQYGYPTLIFINQNQYLVDYTGYLDVSALSAKIDETLGS